jgi:lactoylglutathione lyase
MTFKFEHTNLCVANLEKSLEFYLKALQMKELRRKETDDRILCFLSGDAAPHQIELAYFKHRTEPSNAGENPNHLAFRVDDIDSAKAFHQQMGCFHHELVDFGVYFIVDPDGYSIEIMPTRK